MVESFIYKAFGLIFKSEFEIPELFVYNGVPEVNIVLGEAPQNLKKISKQGVKYQATKNEFLLKVDDIAKYYVCDGNKIIVDLYKENADKEVRLFLLGSVFGALFLQIGLLPIHGSSIKFGSSSTIFTGLSGVGKSSIAAFFTNKGYQALADDISVVNENLEVEPGFPNLKIWDDVLSKLEIHNNSFVQIRPNIKKYQLPIKENFSNEPLQLKNIIVLTARNSMDIDCEELTGIKKFNVIRNNTYRHRFIQGLEKQQDHFQILNELLPKIKVFKVSRPRSPIMIEELGNFIINLLNLDA